MKKELIGEVDALNAMFKTGNLEEREMIELKSDINLLKSKLYINIDVFDSRPECYLYVNMLNSLLDKIDFEMDYNLKLLKKIRQKAIVMLGDGWKDFLKECKNELTC
jgi:hypothetical protein